MCQPRIRAPTPALRAYNHHEQAATLMLEGSANSSPSAFTYLCMRNPHNYKLHCYRKGSGRTTMSALNLQVRAQHEECVAAW